HRPLALAEAAPDPIEDFAGALGVDLVGHPHAGAEVGTGVALGAAEGILVGHAAGAAAEAPAGGALAAAFGQLLGQPLRSLTQLLERGALFADGAARITAAKRAGGAAHRFAGLVELAVRLHAHAFHLAGHLPQAA